MKSILEVLNIFLLQDDEKEPEKEKVNSPNLQKKLSKESELNRENNEEKSLQSPDKNQERIKTGETLQNIPKNPSKVAFEIKSPDYLGKYHEGNLRNTNFDSLLKKLELIRIILEQIMHIFGDLYEFSEDYYFNVVNQALEVVIFNGYSNDKFESMMELFLYQLVLTSLKEDHQSLFSFYYSFYFLKEIGQHNKLLWNFFIQGPIQNSDKTIWFQSSKISENWENLKQVLQESFKITDCNLPQLNIKNNEYIDIKFKRDIENSSSLIQKNKMITEPKLQSSETIPSLNNTNIPTNNNNSNSSFFFPTEANIEGKTKNEEFQNNSLKKRTKNKSSTLYLNVNIPDSSVQKGKYKNYDRKIELCIYIYIFNYFFK